MKKILIYQKENLHTEIIGFFLTHYRKEEIHFCHTFEKSSFNWTNLYAEKLELNIKYVTDDNRLAFNEYDQIIFLTSRDIIEHLDALIGINTEKVLQIRHTPKDKYSAEYPNISLSPLVDADCGNILTIADGCHRSVGELSFDTWQFTVMGISAYSAPKKDIDDLKLFSAKLYELGISSQINVISKKGPHSEELEKLPNVKMHYSLSARESYEVLEKTHFLLPIPKRKGAYYKDRMTGIIPMSYSFGVPMCAPKDFLDIYDVRCQYPYLNSLTDVIGNIVNLSKDDYMENLQNMRRESIEKQVDANNLIKSISDGTIQMGQSSEALKKWF